MPTQHAGSHAHHTLRIAATILIFLFTAVSPLLAQTALVTTVSDDFNRNNGGLGVSWTSLPGGGLGIVAGQATGGAVGQFTGSYRSAESFNPNQYSEIEITSTAFSTSTHQWIGASVRNQANGDLYVGIYWNNLGGTPVLRLYKRIAGNFTQLGTEYASGTLPAGTKLKTIATGTTVSLLLDGTVKISVYDADLGSGSPGIMAYDLATADNWNAGDFSVGAGAASDNFDRVGTSLGANWTGLPDGALALVSNQVSGAAAGQISASMRTSELYDANQYSEIKTTATQLYGNQWIGATVRTQANGDLYLGMYWWNNGNPLLGLYKRISGGFTQLGQYDSGALPAGTALKLMARGTTISFLQDGIEKISIFDNDLYGGAPGIMAYDTAAADNWSAGTANFEAHFLGADTNGVESYNMSSNYNGYGPHALRVLRPDNPAPNTAHNFLFALPVEAEGGNNFGDAMETLRALNAQNAYNVTIIEPSFPLPPWYADSPLDPNYRFESFMVLELQPWVKANLATTGQEKYWLLGFSKSGVGGLGLILKYPDLFTVAAAWDFPANMSTYTQFEAYPNYGTEENFQNNYRLTSGFVNARKAPFLANNRLWISGYNAFQADLNDFDSILTSLGIQHTKGVPSLVSHSWNTLWVPGALAGLSQASIALSDAPPSGGGGGSGTPATAISITVAISAITTNNSAVAAGYLVNESANAPAANDNGWTGTPPSSYTFSSAGTKNLYVWVKDAAGNVSLSSSASVTITLASH